MRITDRRMTAKTDIIGSLLKFIQVSVKSNCAAITFNFV